VKPLLIALLMMMCLALAIAVPAARPVQAGSPKDAKPEAAADMSKAEKYCVRHGGEVDVREPYFNTNDNEQNWLRLSGSREFCKFTSKKDGSRIHVELSTLYTDQPTLAALAYYTQVPYNG
jgi:hypothetical protein